MLKINYDQVISEIKLLNLSDQLRLLEETATLIRKNTKNLKPRSIMELQGKGKDIWKNIDPIKYIDEERSTWNG
ncbi:MAG: hypothetical protein A2464_13080 [Deltaproteobacteria bacterium RIFOXYC2_FULL_48_10]|nr:MAG: hypothetical protein A2464_13080 [Deltaproteobacteria bacterium RIFOXYC2_FULL_48_10]OGR40635.1 MAG: hypothetical protein A3J80_07170 [Desulfobacula sp. RIFOXYB2_FULL_45_6]